MAHRRSFGRGRGISQSQRRKKTWVQLIEVIDGAQTPGFVTNFALTVSPGITPGAGSRDGFIAMSGDGTGANPFISNLPEECTILRVRGSLLFPKSVVSSPVDVADINHSFGFGVTGITDLVSTSYPAPISDSSWDGWMFLRQSALPPVEANSGIIDVKAMRKVKSGDAFFFQSESVAIGTNPPTFSDWQLDLRFLILLP